MKHNSRTCIRKKHVWSYILYDENRKEPGERHSRKYIISLKQASISKFPVSQKSRLLAPSNLRQSSFELLKQAGLLVLLRELVVIAVTFGRKHQAFI